MSRDYKLNLLETKFVINETIKKTTAMKYDKVKCVEISAIF